jgi:hypothetical protein
MVIKNTEPTSGNRFLADYLVLSRFTIPKNRILKIEDEEGAYKIICKVYIEEWKEINISKHFLRCYVELFANDFDEVKAKSLEYLKKHLDIISLLTNQPYIILRLVRIVDWSEGIRKRSIRQFWPLRAANYKQTLRMMMEDINSDKLFKIMKDIECHKRYDQFLLLIDILRNIMLTEDDRSAMINIFSGFEILSYFIQDDHSLVKKDLLCGNCRKQIKCPKCGMNTFQEKPVHKEIIIDILKTEWIDDSANKIWAINNDIKHGRIVKINLQKNGGEVTTEINKLRWDLYYLLRKNILKIIEIPELWEIKTIPIEYGIINIQYDFKDQFWEDSSDIPDINTLPNVDIVIDNREITLFNLYDMITRYP